MKIRVRIIFLFCIFDAFQGMIFYVCWCENQYFLLEESHLPGSGCCWCCCRIRRISYFYVCVHVSTTIFEVIIGYVRKKRDVNEWGGFSNFYRIDISTIQLIQKHRRIRTKQNMIFCDVRNVNKEIRVFRSGRKQICWKSDKVRPTY